MFTLRTDQLDVEEEVEEMRQEEEEEEAAAAAAASFPEAATSTRVTEVRRPNHQGDPLWVQGRDWGAASRRSQ